MEIVHDEAKKQFKVEVDGYTAHVAYQLTEDGGLDIRHTIVPEEIDIRAMLVVIMVVRELAQSDLFFYHNPHLLHQEARIHILGYTFTHFVTEV